MEAGFARARLFTYIRHEVDAKFKQKQNLVLSNRKFIHLGSEQDFLIVISQESPRKRN